MELATAYCAATLFNVRSAWATNPDLKMEFYIICGVLLIGFVIWRVLSEKP